ncbi:MAG TPA: hypothetical protein PK771_12465 [Spirochaetota bacterium]|nr:hypothetical protein [Spirochaetota bacterium]
MENNVKFQIISLISLFVSLMAMAFALVNSIKNISSILEIVIILIIPVIFSIISFFIKNFTVKIVCYCLIVVFYITIFVLMLIPVSSKHM